MSVAGSRLTSFPPYYQPKSSIKNAVHQAQKHLDSLNQLSQDSTMKPALEPKTKNFALVVFGQFANESASQNCQMSRLYEAARCITKIYHGLLQSNFEKNDIHILAKKPSCSVYANYSEHPPREVKQYLEVPIAGLPTHHEINQKIVELFTEAKRGDTVWVFLIGHGDKDNGFVLKDSTSYSSYLAPSHLDPFFKNKTHRDVHFNLVVDCCYSGIFLPSTAENVTVFTSAHFDECSKSKSLMGKRYGTQFVAALENTQKQPLLVRHLSAVDDISPGYDSLMFYLDKFFYDQAGAASINPDTKLPSLISNHQTTVLNQNNRIGLANNLSLPNDSKTTLLAPNHPLDPTLKAAMDLSKAVSTTALNKRYQNLQDKVRCFLAKADNNQIAEFIKIAGPLVENLNFIKKTV